jgi:ankyrin repeat protein
MQETAKVLLAHGAKIGAAAMDDMNALHFAAQKGHAGMISILLDAGKESITTPLQP